MMKCSSCTGLANYARTNNTGEVKCKYCERRFDIEVFDGKYRWLSNFWPSGIVYEDQFFPSVEHAYQAAKTLDLAVRRSISFMATPGMAKKAGNTKLVELRPDWLNVRDEIMLTLTREKYRIGNLRKLLLDTEDAVLIEGNTWNDTYWGVCKNNGQNKLGIIIMNVRKEIKDSLC